MLVSSPRGSTNNDSLTLISNPTKLFNLLHRDIADNKEYAVQQMNIVHSTLDAFEKDFVQRLNTLGDNLKQ
jgi:hypothetical protein